MKHLHGGNIYRNPGCIDFSASVNPLGTPEGVKQAVIRAAEHLAEYPDPEQEALRAAIARVEGVSDKERIVCGNGAAELIWLICAALNPRTAVLPAPTFAEYEAALEEQGCLIVRVPAEEKNGFRHDERLIMKIEEVRPDIVFFCNPDNPTGVLSSGEYMLRLAETCKKAGSFLIIDECFIDFTDNPENASFGQYLNRFPHVIMIKAFTKTYGMAGVRLGYVITADADIAARIRNKAQPWNVSVIAAEAGLAALDEQDFVRRGRKVVAEERAFLSGELGTLGYKVYPAAANYILFRGKHGLAEKCRDRGILIRDCSNFEGLCEGYYRIAVKKHEDNQKLISVLREIDAR
ncbi:MAG: aminotransferase class I/II-fold pyridoxal phosphate-dependent enzyme [Blautia sp.]|nr:aminotransferase class I/II-fold pyridoxal phosphate-dependent enzyme [Blautia sp.]